MFPSTPIPASAAALLVLLRSGLWERDADDLSLFPLREETWEAVFRLSLRQTVTGVVWQGVCRLPDRLLPPERLLLRWLAEADAIERKNRQTNRLLGFLYERFTQSGLTPVLQKGQAVASYYEQPLLRTCGDIDLCFPAKNAFASAVAAAQRLGVSLSTEADDSLHYMYEGICVEHHPRLIDIASPFRHRYLEALERREGFASVCLPGVGERAIRVPSPLLTLLMLNSHILKHVLGRGIGLRQLCDLARACHCLHTTVDVAAWEEALHRLGLWRWSRLLHSFLREFLGLPASCLPEQGDLLPTDALLGVILRGGNFGRYRSGSNPASLPVWRRKMQTARSFASNIRFSCTYAPGEAFWTFAGLLKGQFL